MKKQILILCLMLSIIFSFHSFTPGPAYSASTNTISGPDTSQVELKNPYAEELAKLYKELEAAYQEFYKLADSGAPYEKQLAAYSKIMKLHQEYTAVLAKYNEWKRQNRLFLILTVRESWNKMPAIASTLTVKKETESSADAGKALIGMPNPFSLTPIEGADVTFDGVTKKTDKNGQVIFAVKPLPAYKTDKKILPAIKPGHSLIVKKEGYEPFIDNNLILVPIQASLTSLISASTIKKTVWLRKEEKKGSIAGRVTGYPVLGPDPGPVNPVTGKLRCRINQKLIRSAVELYYQEHGFADGPPSFSMLVEQGYLKSEPKCPSGGAYTISYEPSDEFVCFKEAPKTGADMSKRARKKAGLSVDREIRCWPPVVRPLITVSCSVHNPQFVVHENKITDKDNREGESREIGILPPQEFPIEGAIVIVQNPVIGIFNKANIEIESAVSGQSGKVLDSLKKIAPAFPFIIKKTITDKNGEYSVEGIPPGTYTVTVSKHGYRAISRSVTIKEEGGQVKEDFILFPNLKPIPRPEPFPIELEPAKTGEIKYTEMDKPVNLDSLDRPF